MNMTTIPARDDVYSAVTLGFGAIFTDEELLKLIQDGKFIYTPIYEQALPTNLTELWESFEWGDLSLELEGREICVFALPSSMKTKGFFIGECTYFEARKSIFTNPIEFQKMHRTPFSEGIFEAAFGKKSEFCVIAVDT